ncbi:stalk domain-containing protein [Tumebacillus flagellatus]|uniref:Copper amine oxidase-like N-terminal domain-containing protein n=1 Tax=Tumebacillus flagellatus TaxID=1157490 RepID=A0A074LS21_9BACL|nr:stalk domain-containing protein [Tumebacillus flagellatus]KEO83285.1 hypothetical protein EL26_11390 [Tumebacillus flagellatus]
MSLRPARHLLLSFVLASGLVATAAAPPSAQAAAVLATRPGAAQIAPGTLLIGTYLVQKEALTKGVFAAAKATMQSSGQGVYYRSEFAGGAWMNIGKANDVNALFKGKDSVPVSFDDIDNLQIQFSITLQQGKPHIDCFLKPADLKAAIEDAQTKLDAKKQEADSKPESQLYQTALETASLQAQLDFLTAVQNGQGTEALQALEKQADPASAVPTDLQKAQQTQRQNLQAQLDAAKSNLAAAQSAGNTAQIQALQTQVNDLTAQLQKFDVQIKKNDLITAQDTLTAKLKDLQSAITASQSQKAANLLLEVATAAQNLEDVRQALLQQQVALTTDPKAQEELKQAAHTATQDALKDQNLKLRKAQETAKLTGQTEVYNLIFAQITDNNAKRGALRQEDRQARIDSLQSQVKQAQANLQAAVTQLPAGQTPSGAVLLPVVTTQAALKAEQQNLPDAKTIAQEDIDFLQAMIEAYQAEDNQAGVNDLQPLLGDAMKRRVDAAKAVLFLQKYEAESVQGQQPQPSPELAGLHKQTIEAVEAVEKGRYSQAELDAIAQIAAQIQQQITGQQGGNSGGPPGNAALEILPVERLISKSIDFNLTAPLLRLNGTTMVPIRALLEGFGATVDWDDAEQMVRVEYRGRTVVAWIGKNSYGVNGEPKTLDVSPVLLAQRTYVPLRLLVEAFGFDVSWDEPTESIDVKALPAEVNR